ncbi:MAG: EAL domain-containing protein [Actinobacteria bacterium]|nr:EAL domain-containing protein [Actinomycetota bacterium]
MGSLRTPPAAVPARPRPTIGGLRASGIRGKPLTTLVVVLGLGTAAAVSAVTDAGSKGTVPVWVIPLVFLLTEVHGLADRRGISPGAIAAGSAAMAFALLEGPARLAVPSHVGAVLLMTLAFGSVRSTVFLRRLGAASISASASVAVFGLLRDHFAAGDWRPAVLAALAGGAAAGLIHVATSGIPGLTSGERFLEALLGLSSVLAGGALAVIAANLVAERRWSLAALLVLPFVSTALALRARERENRRLVQLSGLQESLQMAQRAHGLESAISQLLASTRRLVDADAAWIVILSRENDKRLLAEICHGVEERLRPVGLSLADDAAIRHAVFADGPVTVSIDSAPADIRAAFSERGVEHGLLIALRGDRGVHSVLAVGRADAHEPFSDAEARLFQTFGTHAGLMLENDSLEQSLNELTVLKEELRHRAYHDTLTGLANRTLFYDSVSQALAERDAGRRVAVLFLDLDDFKTVNDTLGHSAGDDLLLAVAARVEREIRPSDTAARLGGDEFAVLAEVLTEEEAVSIGQRLLDALEAPFTINGQDVAVHSSVGIAFAGNHTGAEELLRQADVAMYAAKRQGKRRLSVFEPQMQEQVRARHEMATALARSVDRGEILVHYQPIVDMETGALVALEALARWGRAGKPLMGPGGFISLADEIGLMPEIGRVVLHEACKQVRGWQRAFPDHSALTVTVNLAPSELHSRQLVREVARALAESGLPPDRLVLEITESGVMHRPREALRTMEELRRLGVSLALDDFGTGHSSLAHMRDFPMDVLKIAQPFIARLPHSEVDAAFVETIMRLATSLGMHVIAEGIESPAQAASLEHIGCRFGQGFLYGEPSAPIGVTRYLVAPHLPHVVENEVAA